MSSTSPCSTRFLATAAALLALGLCLSACAPETADSLSPTRGATSTPVPSADPTATESADLTALPAECNEAYSPQTLGDLASQGLPLNDPDITLLPTQEAPLLELLEQIPTIRCTWGAPGDRGISTSISLVDTKQAAVVLDSLEQAGFLCEPQNDETLCRIEQRGVSLDDLEYVRGETHAVRGDLWVATSWLNLPTDDYVQDILDTLQG